MEWKTGLPKVSGEYVVYTTYGKIATLIYSAKHKLFNSVNSMNTEEALKVSLNDDIEKWIELDNFVKNYVLSDEEYLKSLKDKEKELKSNCQMKKVEVLLNTIDDKEEDVCRICYKDKYLRRCKDSTSCSKCEFFNAKNVLEYLNKFHYPLVTLTLFETEILKSYNEENAKFSENKVLMILKENGYYKEIEPEMTIKEILENTLIKTP